jgi:hypothetical protein
MRPLRSPHTLVILAGYAAGAAALYIGLPDQIPPSWAGAVGGTVWFGGAMVAFLLPTAAAVTDALLRALCIKHPIDAGGSREVLPVYDAIMLRFVMFIIGVHATVLLGVLGQLSGRGWTSRIVPVMLGLAMIGIGNLLPRTRPNLAIGIRTRATLSDRALWIRTHRSTGYLVVTLGMVIVLSAIAVPAPIGRTMALVAGPAGLFGICFLVRYSRTHVHGDR